MTDSPIYDKMVTPLNVDKRPEPSDAQGPPPTTDQLEELGPSLDGVLEAAAIEHSDD